LEQKKGNKTNEPHTPSPSMLQNKSPSIYFFFFLNLQGKSEEEVSSAGEQLTSNRIYDGENTKKSFWI